MGLGTDWLRLLDATRHQAKSLSRVDIPKSPGVYAWFHNDVCVYVGKASDLRSRLGQHLAESLDLSRSTLRSWVAVRELGYAREYTRRRPTVMSVEDVNVVNAWLRACEIAWLTSSDNGEAALLEHRLLADWRPEINAR